MSFFIAAMALGLLDSQIAVVQCPHGTAWVSACLCWNGGSVDSCHCGAHGRVEMQHDALQGIAALMAFNLLDADHDLVRHPWGSAEHLHACIEAMRLSFADTLKYNADPAVEAVPIAELLDKQNAAQQWSQVFNPSQVSHGMTN